MKTQKRSLADVVEERRKTCMLCEIKEREEIEAERKNGAEVKHIIEWLVKDCGYPEAKVQAQRNQISRHFILHVDRKKNGREDYTLRTHRHRKA